VAPFYDDPAYVSALAARVRASIGAGESPDHFVLSFHGLPERYCTTGDPYREHCERTAALLAAEMNWSERDYTICFQSRFGRERWLQPYTVEVLRGLPGRGIKRPLVVTPGFTTDCLETLDELGREGREIFHAAGGDRGAYRLCPCLNDSREWIECMKELVIAR
jgi:ferrochelatase